MKARLCVVGLVGVFPAKGGPGSNDVDKRGTKPKDGLPTGGRGFCHGGELLSTCGAVAMMRVRFHAGDQRGLASPNFWPLHGCV